MTLWSDIVTELIAEWSIAPTYPFPTVSQHISSSLTLNSLAIETDELSVGVPYTTGHKSKDRLKSRFQIQYAIEGAIIVEAYKAEFKRIINGHDPNTNTAFWHIDVYKTSNPSEDFFILLMTGEETKYDY